MRKIVWVLAIFVSGCYKGGLYVQQERLDRDFLASVHVGTPDPKKENPPKGERLLVGWRLPFLWIGETEFRLRVRFWDEEEELICDPVESSHGSKAYSFPDRKILTYRLDVVDREGTLLESWEHQLWTELICFPKQGQPCETVVKESSSSVSSQPMQPSVTETP